MMDLKEIIKWFIPCFHILLIKKVKMMKLMTYFCVFLLFFARPSSAANINLYSGLTSENITKNLDSVDYFTVRNNQSEFGVEKVREARSLDTSVGRTFGRPLKKLAAALIPLAFQLGAASTWAVVAAVVGVKTLLVSLVILKILLLAGAVKVGAFFGQKAHGHGGHGWEQPHQKEIHLHIHNGHGHEGQEEHIPISSWSREGATDESKDVNLVLNPYSENRQVRKLQNKPPETISTPYGKYIRLEPNNNIDISTLQAKLAAR